MREVKKKVILIPYPAQGHVTPMLKLAWLLKSEFSLEPVVVVPDFMYGRISHQIDEDDRISCMSIPDGLGMAAAAPDFFSIENAMENHLPRQLEYVVARDVDGILCFIVDLLASWAITVADKYGIQVSGFWPVMHTTYRLVQSIPTMLKSGIVPQNGCPVHGSSICLHPGQPTLTTNDLPWLIGSSESITARFNFWKRTLDRSNNLRWLLMNTFPDEYCGNSKRNIPIGPLNVSAHKVNPSLWKEDKSCLEWLNTQKNGSVMYISFGSWISPLQKQDLNNLAMSLVALERPFLWALAHSWRQGIFLPTEQGRIVSWAPQMEVLQHDAVGCYLTHCGWNSIMESIQCKKPLLCYPVAGDQFVNCAYVVDDWQIGVRIQGFGIKELEQGSSRLMGNGDIISQRILILNERLFGNEARSKAMANLQNFVNNLSLK